MDWGSASVDRDRGLMLVNANRVAVIAQLIPRKQADAMGIQPNGANSHSKVGVIGAQAGTPYAILVGAFLSPLGVPCQQPPYGTLNAVDIKTRRVLWSEPFGSGRDSGPLGIASRLPFTMGVPSIGGPVTTRSGLTFIAASQDDFLRAYETGTGHELWRGRLPAGGQATPAIYRSPASGQEFVIIAAGGHPFFQTRLGNSIVAYALPAIAK
jgi:quinoprotein glucose dehydrogenase